MKKKVVILGSTGSIGKQTLNVVSDNINEFDVIGISGWEDTKLIKEQILNYHPKIAVVKNEYYVKKLKNSFSSTPLV